MSKRKATTQKNIEFKRLKIDSEKPEGLAIQNSDTSAKIAVVKPTIEETSTGRPENSSSNFESTTLNQSNGISNRNTLTRSRRAEEQDFHDTIFCLCDTPFRCQLPECQYTDITYGEFCAMHGINSE